MATQHEPQIPIRRSANVPRQKRWSKKTRTGCRTCRLRRIKCDELRPECRKCFASGRQCGGYEVSAVPPSRPPLLLAKEASPAVLNIVPAPRASPSQSVNGLDAQAFDFFRVRAAPTIAGHFSANLWEYLVLQLSQRHLLIRQASTAVGAMTHFLSSGPGCLASSKTAKSQYSLALTNYGKAVAGLRAYIEKTSATRDNEVTFVVLVSCLLFICFEMLQGDQKSVISHLIRGLKILFAQHKPVQSASSAMRPVILGSDFPDAMDSLIDVFVRLDADSTMFGRRSTYLSTTCRCCCQGSEVGVVHDFRTVKEARSHLDLLTNSTFNLRGRILKLTEKTVASQQSGEEQTSPLEAGDWARRYCNLYALSRSIDLTTSAEGKKLLAKQEELTVAFEAWSSGLAGLASDADKLSVLMLRIQHFFAWFVVSTLRDRTEMLCDRFSSTFTEVVELAREYMENTKHQVTRCGFALESGVLRSLYIIGLKCRDSCIRRHAVALLRSATVQEGLWSGKVFAAYLQRIIVVEEAQARQLMPGLAASVDLTYNTMPEEARFRDVVLASDDTRPLTGRIVCAQPAAEDGIGMTFMEDTFELFSI